MPAGRVTSINPLGQAGPSTNRKGTFMADTDRRSGAELRARRELLGLNAQETAALLVSTNA